ncbi:MAG: adenine phosphoribosyltransferase [Eubacteriales bacterium]
MKKLEEYVRSIPDFPEEGIIFRDVTSVIEDAEGLRLSIDTMQGMVDDLEYDVIAGAEARGFIFGTPMAYNNQKPFVLIRKKGKLPCETVEKEYALEYGTAVIEMHKDSIKPGQKVLLVDDLIATGGTTKAMIELIEEMGGIVAGVVVLIELAGLEGRKAIEGYRLDSAIIYPGK